MLLLKKITRSGVDALCVLLAVFLLGCGSGNHQNKNTMTSAVVDAVPEKQVVSQSSCFPVDTARLGRAFRELIKNPYSLDCQNEFFYAFPSTWLEFLLTYNFDFFNKNLSNSQIDAFGRLLPLIPDTIYCVKLINLCIGGKWGPDLSSDVPGGLQDLVRNFMSQKPQVMFSCLSKHTRGFQLRFWQFYWSSLHKVDNAMQCQRLKNMFWRTMPDEVKIMEIGCEFATEEFDTHSPYEDFPHLTIKSQIRPEKYP